MFRWEKSYKETHVWSIFHLWESTISWSHCGLADYKGHEIHTYIYIYIQLYINHQQSLLSWPWEPSENAGSSSIVVMACLNFLTLQKSDCLHVAWALSKCGNSEPSKEI